MRPVCVLCTVRDLTHYKGHTVPCSIMTLGRRNLHIYPNAYFRAFHGSYYTDGNSEHVALKKNWSFRRRKIEL